MVILYESRNHKVVGTKFRALKKKFKHILKDEFYAKAKKFVDILMRLNKAAQEGKKVFLKSAYKNFVRDFPSSEIGDNQIILYEVYLASKLDENATYYELFCKEIQKRQG